jgi:hypothetical protein
VKTNYERNGTMKKIPKQYRQGDVLLTPVGTLPGNAVKQPHVERLVLAEGEATGHSHAISAPAGKYNRYLAGTELYLEVLEAVDLEHQEHGTATAEPEIYLVKRQTEDWYGETRQVAD